MNEKAGTLASAIRAFIAERLASKLNVFDKNAEKRRSDALADHLQTTESQIQEERRQLTELYKPSIWLTEAAKRAAQISMVTHAPKYTHSDTKSMGILLRSEERQSYGQAGRYVDSSSVENLTADVVGNAAALDVARLLQIEANGESLFEQVASGNSPALIELAADAEQAQCWLKGFKGALQEKVLASGQLSKQLYFPVDDGYHLVAPLYASSLSQQLYERITDSFYSENSKAMRQARKAGKYHPETLVVFPDVAVQGFGGTKPQNISQLNTKRYGRAFLLSSQPPRWGQSAVLPGQGKRAFWQLFDRHAWGTAKTLQRYLEAAVKRASTRERRDRRAELVDELIETLLVTASGIQRLKKKRGWSTESDLSRAEQLWLDPYRGEVDQAFKDDREKNDWQNEIARQFAAWLNYKISNSSDRLRTADPEFAEWQKLLERKLLLLKDDLEVVA